MRLLRIILCLACTCLLAAETPFNRQTVQESLKDLTSKDSSTIHYALVELERMDFSPPEAADIRETVANAVRPFLNDRGTQPMRADHILEHVGDVSLARQEYLAACMRSDFAEKRSNSMMDYHAKKLMQIKPLAPEYLAFVTDTALNHDRPMTSLVALEVLRYRLKVVPTCRQSLDIPRLTRRAFDLANIFEADINGSTRRESRYRNLRDRAMKLYEELPGTNVSAVGTPLDLETQAREALLTKNPQAISLALAVLGNTRIESLSTLETLQTLLNEGLIPSDHVPPVERKIAAYFPDLAKQLSPDQITLCMNAILTAK